MTTAQYLILGGVLVYFSIGAFISYGITIMSMGFAGKFEPMAIPIFFFWPFFYLIRFTPAPIILPFAAAVAAMVGLAYFLMTRFS